MCTQFYVRVGYIYIYVYWCPTRFIYDKIFVSFNSIAISGTWSADPSGSPEFFFVGFVFLNLSFSVLCSDYNTDSHIKLGAHHICKNVPSYSCIVCFVTLKIGKTIPNIWYNMLMMKSADLLFVNTDHMLLFISVVLTPMFVTWQNDRILQLSPMA
jgi:hypothetical protein